MDKAHFEQIKQYGAMLAIAGHLHKRGLITDAEHHKLTEEIQKKYRPASGSAAGFSPVLNNLTEKVPGQEDLEYVWNCGLYRNETGGADHSGRVVQAGIPRV